MVKKAITIRLDEETLKKIDDRGKRSDVIRNIIEYALKPKIPEKTIEPKVTTIIKEVPVETVRYVTINPFDFTKMNKELFRDIIKDEILKGMPKWYLDSRVKDWERQYGEKFQ
jgi:hypothetical protein